MVHRKQQLKTNPPEVYCFVKKTCKKCVNSLKSLFSQKVYAKKVCCGMLQCIYLTAYRKKCDLLRKFVHKLSLDRIQKYPFLCCVPNLCTFYRILSLPRMVVTRDAIKTLLTRNRPVFGMYTFFAFFVLMLVGYRSKLKILS